MKREVMYGFGFAMRLNTRIYRWIYMKRSFQKLIVEFTSKFRQEPVRRFFFLSLAKSTRHRIYTSKQLLWVGFQDIKRIVLERVEILKMRIG